MRLGYATSTTLLLEHWSLHTNRTLIRAVSLAACQCLQTHTLHYSQQGTEILWCSTTRWQNHLLSAAVRVGENHVLPSTTVHDLGVHHWLRCRYAVSCVVYGVRMFRCVTTAPQHQTLSVRFCVPFAGRVTGYATSWLQRRNTRRTSCVSVDFSQCSMPPPDWHIDLLGMSMSHQCCKTYTGCGLINFKLAVLTYRCLHGLAPRYLSDYIQSVAVSNCRRHLHS